MIGIVMDIVGLALSIFGTIFSIVSYNKAEKAKQTLAFIKERMHKLKALEDYISLRNTCLTLTKEFIISYDMKGLNKDAQKLTLPKIKSNYFTLLSAYLELKEKMGVGFYLSSNAEAVFENICSDMGEIIASSIFNETEIVKLIENLYVIKSSLERQQVLLYE